MSTLADHQLDADEKRVLANVFERAEADGVDTDVLARIGQLRSEHGPGRYGRRARRPTFPAAARR